LRASAYVGESVDQPLLYYRNNFAGTAVLLQTVVDHHRVPVVFSSSCATYGIPERVPIAEDHRNNTVNSRALIEAAVKAGVRYFIFSSTAVVYGNPQRVPVREDDPTVPTSPYGSSKLMSEIMLRDAGMAHGLRYVILRYFNVAGADPLGRPVVERA
jgi:UDP-glucose 4-epimerase